MKLTDIGKLSFNNKRWRSVLGATFFSRTGLVADDATLRRFIRAALAADRAGKVPHDERYDSPSERAVDCAEYLIHEMEDDAIARGQLPSRELVSPTHWRAWVEEAERRRLEECRLAAAAWAEAAD
jgi:hypothetical protein